MDIIAPECVSLLGWDGTQYKTLLSAGVDK